MSEIENQEGASKWNSSPLTAFLLARSTLNAEAALDSALPVISEIFPPDVWGNRYTINEYGTGAHGNLYNVESQREFRQWLRENNVTVEAYADAVGPLQYVSLQLHLLSLMERARSNRGWRVTLMGFPPLKILVLGLSSHYQGTQNHNRMGRASELIRTRALEVLTGEPKQTLETWPSATSEDWEERGLMTEPVRTIGSLDISTFDEGRGAKLRMVRNTTVKKELSTFFAIKGLTQAQFQQEGYKNLIELRDIALALGRGTIVE